jgi:hypothetical protein
VVWSLVYLALRHVLEAAGILACALFTVDTVFLQRL